MMDFDERQEIRDFLKAAAETFSKDLCSGTPITIWALKYQAKHNPEAILKYKRDQNAWARSHWLAEPFPDVK
jgi:hypothetical protein